MQHTTRAQFLKLITIAVLATYFLFNYSDKSTSNMTILNHLTEVPANWQPLRILTANVGNLSLNCGGKYNHKLCLKSVEEAISESIQNLQPDIVFLQELMHPSQCDNWVETDAKKVCFDSNKKKESNQARRLLGKDYTIVCASRERTDIDHPIGMECIGVHTKAGIIEECQLGELCYSVDNSDILGKECDPGFIIMSVTANVKNLAIRLVNAHPHSINKYCRDNSLNQIFEDQNGIPALGSSGNVIIAGDFNFNPFRAEGDSPAIWRKHVGLFDSGKPFYYHSGLAEHNPPYPTAYFLFQKKTIDHVISNFASGVCITLGEAPDTFRIDGGKGMDHRAVLCDMWIPGK